MGVVQVSEAALLASHYQLLGTRLEMLERERIALNYTHYITKELYMNVLCIEEFGM